MAHANWHYSRTAFAEEVYDLLTKTPAYSATLFGPRRSGKTEFLLDDIGPHASRRRHRVVYANFWQTPETPIAVLLYALERALSATFAQQMAELAKRTAPNARIALPGIGEIGLSTRETKAVTASQLLQIDKFCDRLANPKKPTFVLLDEFQAIANATNGKTLIAALRTSLDTRRTGLVSIFTGSSQVELDDMFSAKDAPFYRFATSITLPPLGEAFIDHQLGVAGQLSKRKIKRADALDVFARVEGGPLAFQRWVQTMMTRPSLDPRAALNEALRGLGKQAGFDAEWNKLSARQRAVTRLLADGETEVFSEAAAQRIAALAHCPPPSSTQVQSDTRRLKRAELAESRKRSWSLTDPLFAVWVRNQPAQN